MNQAIATTTAPNADLDPLRVIANEALANVLADRPGCPARLAEAMRYSVLGPGKRLRPILVLLANRAVGGQPEQAIPAACAVELIHAYSLVHDDLPAMDDDDLRRGRPTCHRQFDEATAILVGDALQALAFELLATRIEPAARAAQCCAALAQAAGAGGLVGGQADDLGQQGLPTELATLQAIHRRKTGAMFRVSLELGGLSASAAPEQMTSLREYGEAFGMAFQITDDLLDAQGCEKTVGKRVGKDAARGKTTYPGLLGLPASHLAAVEAVDRACLAAGQLGPAAEPLARLARALVDRQS